jgi:hypothetical protein
MWKKNGSKQRWRDENMESEWWASSVSLHNFFKNQLVLGNKICMTQELQMDRHLCERMEWHVPYNTHFSLGVRANVQPKSNIESICAKVEFSLEGFRMEWRLKKKRFFLSNQCANKCWKLWPYTGPKAEKRIP